MAAVKSRIIAATLVVALIWLALPWGVSAEPEKRKDVLVLHSYNKGYKWTDDIMSGIVAVLGADTQRVRLTVEYMDTKRVTDTEYIEKLYGTYKFKFRNQRYDAVICSDDAAYHFLLKYHEELFPNTPIVFCGVNYYEDKLLEGKTNFTGVVEYYDIRQTLDTALALHPGTKRVYVINDHTITGAGVKRTLLDLLAQYDKPVNFISLEEYSMDEILERVGALTDDSLILYLVFTQDITGKFFSPDESIRMIAAKSRVPIYGVWEFDLGHGIVGGMLTSGYYQGSKAAQLTARILGGELPASIPVVKEGPNYYVFDDVQLKRYNIPLSGLPQESVIINQAFSNRVQVLVLNSYHRDMPWVQSMEAGLQSVFAPNSKVELYYDYMDAKRNPDPVYIASLYETYKIKYGKKKFDAVIVTDDVAYNFMRNFHKELVPGTPVVFCGVNYIEESSLPNRELFTGVVEKVDIAGTLKIALTLHPKTRQVVVVNDTTELGRTNRRLLEQIMPEYADRVDFVFYEDMNMLDIQKNVAVLPPDSIILLMAFNKDKSNNVFSYEESLELIAASARVPIYGFWDFYLGHGVVGGMMTSGFAQGEIAAQMTTRILRGVKPDTIPLELAGRNQYMFDYGQLAKFNVSQGLIPVDSIIINEPVSFYSQHKALVLGVGAFIAVLLVAIIGLNINIIKRKRAEKELQVYATTDPMTGLCNRRTGLAILAEQLALAESQKAKLAVCFLDIDGLKMVNDNYGHHVGDMLIKTVGRVVAASVRDQGTVCRFGGDEFLVVLPNCGLLQAEALFTSIKAKLAETKIEHYELRPAISCGFAEYDPVRPVSMDELIRVADNKMYARKKGKPK